MTKTLIFKPSILILTPFFAVTIVAAISAPILSFSTLSLVLLGVCAWVTYLNVRKLPKEYYLVSDHSIQVKSHKEDTTISLVNITQVTSKRHWQIPFTSYGQVLLKANGRQHIMRGLKDAASIAEIISQAVDAAIARENRKSGPLKFTPPLHAPGTLEQMNDLVGLWQQGILSDEEYRQEAKRLTTDQ